MRAGELDRSIVIRQVAVGQNAIGEETETWSDLATVWAKVRQKSEREGDGPPGIIVSESSTFLIRHRTDVTRKMKILYDSGLRGADALDDWGRLSDIEVLSLGVVVYIFDIASLKEIGRAEGLEITATAQVD